MYLHALTLKGFRQFVDTTVRFSDATFIIGQNNTGKSSILKAIECLLKAVDKLPQEDYLQMQGEDGSNKIIAEKVEIIGEFRNVPEEAKTWRGFKGRLFEYEIESGSSDSGLKIIYRKEFPANGGKVNISMQQSLRNRNSQYSSCSKPSDFIASGLADSVFEGIREPSQFGKALKDEELQLLDEIWDIDESSEEWFQNPGGIVGNVYAPFQHR